MEPKEVNHESEYDELYADILENWNSPINVTSIVHQNPFSKNHHQSNPLDDIKREATLQSLQLSTQDTHPLYCMPNSKSLQLSTQDTHPLYCMPNSKTGNEGSTELQHKEDKTVHAAIKTSYEAEKGNEVKDEEDNLRIILNSETGIEKLRSGHEILKGDFLINRCMPATSYYSLTTEKKFYASSSVAKSKFVLPSYRSICDINIDNIREKSWRKPGVDMSDFFNYGMDEKQWKDYCKLMRPQAQVKKSGQSAMGADKCRRSHKEGDTGEVKLGRAINECLNFKYSKNLSLYDSHVIIEIAMREPVYKRAQPLSERDNTPRINCRIIKGEKIVPFPIDSYSAEYHNFNVVNLNTTINKGHNYKDLKHLSLCDSHIIEIALCDTVYEKDQPISDIDNTPCANPRLIKGDKILPLPMDSCSDENRDKRLDKRLEKRAEQENHKCFKKTRGYSLIHDKRKRFGFNLRCQQKLDVNLAESSCSSNSEIEMEGNTEEILKKRRERFKLPLSNKPVLLHDVANTDPDIKGQRPTRRRKWTSS